MSREPVSKQELRAAARLRVTLDRKRGIETEQWIIDIANDTSFPENETAEKISKFVKDTLDNEH